MSSKLTGLHHITAVASDFSANVAFYRDLLGLKLVKQTVNFDDTNAFHLYYGDQTGSPGSLVTFFIYPGTPRYRPGYPQIRGIWLSVSDAHFGQIEQRLTDGGRAFTRGERGGVPALHIYDDDGLPVVVLNSQGKADTPRLVMPPVQVQHAAGTAAFLRDRLGFEGDDHALTLPGTDVVVQLVDLKTDPQMPRGRHGAGEVHHVALRVPDDETEIDVLRVLQAADEAVSPVIDRTYFHSVYVRERGGILLEIATDPPGMHADGEQELGSTLQLPPHAKSSR